MNAAAEAALMLLAGLAAGIVGAVAGLASLVSYPALLAAGLNPLAANVTNTVALVLTGVGSTAASRSELTGQGTRVRRFAVASVAGGVTGAVLLLVTPPDAPSPPSSPGSSAARRSCCSSSPGCAPSRRTAFATPVRR